MAMLGDILAEARRSSACFGRWLGARHPELMARVQDAASRLGESETGFVRASVSDFACSASEEDWATLLSALRDSPDPGFECLAAMVSWRLAAAEGHFRSPLSKDLAHARRT
jgi:hypothetical protein